MLIIYIMFIIITVIGAFSLSQDSITDSSSNIASLWLTAVMFFYILSAFALYLVTFIYMCFCFYKTMYSNQGYLTHTLPVKTSTIFHTKLFVSFVWMLCSSLLFLISIVIFVIGATQGEIFEELAIYNWTTFEEEFVALMGMSLGSFLVRFFVVLVLSCLSSLLWIFTCLSIGQLFQQHKIAAAVITGVILYVINQIADFILLSVSNYLQIAEPDMISYNEINFTFGDTMLSMMNNSMLYSILLIIIYYIVCRVILQKHINLD